MNLEDQEAHEVERALMMIKRLGAGRTRGYGRCEISMEEKRWKRYNYNARCYPT